jgi:hypothetical protein
MQPHINQIVEFDRGKLDPHSLRGFVLAYSEALTLLNVLTDDYFLNGYSVIRNQDVVSYSPYDSPDYFLNRAVRLKGIKPKRAPKVDISDWPLLLKTANQLFPLITIHRELISTDVCHIGTIQTMRAKTFDLFEIDPDAEWERERKYRFADVTKVDFAGGYEDALWRVAEEDGLPAAARPNKSLDASGTSGLVIDNLPVTRLSPAASTQPLSRFAF